MGGNTEGLLVEAKEMRLLVLDALPEVSTNDGGMLVKVELLGEELPLVVSGSAPGDKHGQLLIANMHPK